IIETLEIGQIDRIPSDAIAGPEHHRLADAIGQTDSRSWTTLTFIDGTIDRIRSQSAQEHYISVEVVNLQAASHARGTGRELQSQSILKRQVARDRPAIASEDAEGLA